MFLFDTNILSAMMRLDPVPEVRAWMAGRDRDLFFTTCVSQAEILSGLAIMVDGRRRRDLQALAAELFAEEFEGRILSFDSAAATAYGEIFAARRNAGRPIQSMDLLIASIARSHGASVVTRDTGGFEDCGLTVINPWTAS